MVTNVLKHPHAISALFEKHYPALGAVVAVAGAFYFAPTLVATLAEQKWSLANLFGAAFDWSAIQTAFIFGIYAFVLGYNGEFLSQVRDSAPFQHFLRYAWQAIMHGFLLTISSIPLMVIEPQVTSPYGLLFTIVSIWFGLFVMAVLSFFRVAYIFALIARIRDQLVYRG
jgi:hypothetical protein